MEEQKRERHTRRHPVRAFFRGMQTGSGIQRREPSHQRPGAVVWSGGGAACGGLGWLVRPSVGGGEPPAGGHRMGDVPAAPGRLAGGVDVPPGRHQNGRGNQPSRIQAARGEQPVPRLLAPVIFAATLLTHGFGGCRPAGRGRPCSWGAPWPRLRGARGESWGPSFRTWRSCAV